MNLACVSLVVLMAAFHPKQPLAERLLSTPAARYASLVARLCFERGTLILGALLFELQTWIVVASAAETDSWTVA